MELKKTSPKRIIIHLGAKPTSKTTLPWWLLSCFKLCLKCRFTRFPLSTTYINSNNYEFIGYTGCHKYVPFARFAKERHYGVSRFEIIIKDDNRYVIRAFGSDQIGCYRQPGEDPADYRYRKVILTNALTLT